MACKLGMEYNEARPISGTHGRYFVTDTGEVYSKKYKKFLKKQYNSANRSSLGSIKLGVNDSRGYMKRYVAELVWEAYFGEIPSGMVVVHKSNDRADDSVWNLMLVDRKDVRHTCPKRVYINGCDRDPETIEEVPPWLFTRAINEIYYDVPIGSFTLDDDGVYGYESNLQRWRGEMIDLASMRITSELKERPGEVFFERTARLKKVDGRARMVWTNERTDLWQEYLTGISRAMQTQRRTAR